MRAIVVDDQELSLEILLLQLNGFECLEDIQAFTDPEKAAAYAKDHPVDIAFLDIVMDKIDGITLAGAIRAFRPACYIIFTTASADFALDAFKVHASGYLVKPVTKAAIREQLDAILVHQNQHREETGKNLRVQCFGNFEVFDSAGRPLAFRYKKSKELLAYLIHRKGAVCSNAELASVLYEDRDDSVALQSLLRNLIADLSRTLREADASDSLYREHGGTAIVPERIDCDYYDYVNGSSVSAFSGEYMTQYEWAEEVNAFLNHQKEN